MIDDKKIEDAANKHVDTEYARYNSGEVEVRINPAKKDGTRSNRMFVLWSMEIDSIKKIS